MVNRHLGNDPKKPYKINETSSDEEIFVHIKLFYRINDYSSKSYLVKDMQFFHSRSIKHACNTEILYAALKENSCVRCLFSVTCHKQTSLVRWRRNSQQVYIKKSELH